MLVRAIFAFLIKEALVGIAYTSSFLPALNVNVRPVTVLHQWKPYFDDEGKS